VPVTAVSDSVLARGSIEWPRRLPDVVVTPILPGMVERERDLDRLLTFVDAIVAIAITLLVLPLVDVAGELDGASVTDVLAEHSAELFGFLLSFAVIAQLWTSHHQIVSGSVRQGRWMVRLTLAWALTIVFLPFPTELVAEAPDEAATKVLYIGTMAASSAILALIALVLSRNSSLRDTDEGPEPLVAAGSSLAFLAALAVSVMVPATGYWPLLLLVLTNPLVNRYRAGRLRTRTR
jgi:uncharacterized membrane protein